jgi:asparagine synthase (glutamine-hydrolysing)
VQLEGEPSDPISSDTLHAMAEVMRHRGPDDVGVFTSPGVALGVRRLSIIDVEDGHQPFSNEDGTIWGVQNGELYEHDTIREQLRSSGHAFTSRCDTEIIPHLYEDLGVDFATRIRGMFGIAVWDQTRRRAVLARDRLGIKPLYYANAGRTLVFASELKSLLASGLVDAELDYAAIDAYLTLGFFPAPLTPLVGVRKVLPGHYLVVENGVVQEHRYWSYPTPAPDGRLSLDEQSERLLAKLDESVRLRLMSDVPLGAMLSGGLDSSVIVALMARHMSEPVKTFSVGFAGAGQTNELADARLVSRVLGTEHHEMELSLDDRVDLEDLCWHMDEPVADLSALGFRAISELAARHVTVALSGQGADELLAGYRKYRAVALSGALDRTTFGVAPRLAELAGRRTARGRRVVSVLAARDPVERLLAVANHLPPDRENVVRGPLLGVQGTADRVIRSRLGDGGTHALEGALSLDAQLGLPDDMLHYFDRASMAHSLEVRVPFLDHELVEHCASVPTRFKLHRFSRGKHVLKHAARGLVPDEVIDKPKVGFFNRTVESWVQSQTTSAISDYLLDPAAQVNELVNRDRIAAISRAGADGRDAYLLLALLMLEIWLSTFVPRAVSRPAPV